VYVTERTGAVPTFGPAPPLLDPDVARVQNDAQTRIERVLCACDLLAREGTDSELLEGYEDASRSELWSASLDSQTVAGDRFIEEVLRLVDPEGTPAPE
jgi:hypothetical protein